MATDTAGNEGDQSSTRLLEDDIASITDENSPGNEVMDEPDESAGDDAGGNDPGDEASDTSGNEDQGDEQAAGDETPPEKKRQPWQAKRFGKMKEEAESAKREAAEARRELEEFKAAQAEGNEGGRLYTQAEVDARVETEASRRASMTVTNDKLDALFDQGVKAYKDFDKRVAAYGEAFGPELASRVDFFSAVAKLPNGADVVYTLGGDLDHMAEILDMAPVDMGMELARLSADLAKPKAPKVSKAPAPIKPLETRHHTEMGIDDPNLPAAEFERRMNKLMADNREDR